MDRNSINELNDRINELYMDYPDYIELTAYNNEYVHTHFRVCRRALKNYLRDPYEDNVYYLPFVFESYPILIY